MSKGKLPYFINEHGLCLKLNKDVIPYINSLNEILNEIGNMNTLKYEILAMINPTYLQSKYNLNDNFIKWWDDVVKYKLYKLLPNIIDDYITGFEIVNTVVNNQIFDFSISFDNLFKKIESDNITKDNFDYYFFNKFLLYDNNYLKICSYCHMTCFHPSCSNYRTCSSCEENLIELRNLYYTYNLFCDYKKYINEAVNNLINFIKSCIKESVDITISTDYKGKISYHKTKKVFVCNLLEEFKEEIQKQRKEFFAYKAEKQR